MKKTALVTGGTAKDAPAMASLLLNIKHTNNILTDDIIIYHNGISNLDQTIMKKIMPVQFRLYNYPGKTEKFKDVVNNYFSTMIFCKYECFNLLNEYKAVIWTDFDVIINNDINELLTVPSSGFKLMPDISHTVRTMFEKDINNTIENYKLDIPGICLSIFVLFDNMIYYNEYYKYCIEQTDRFAPYLNLPEQCIINLLLQDYNIQYDSLDYKTYCVHPLHDIIKEHTKIIHAYGQPKFWNGLYNAVWEKNYKTWIKMGGSEYFHRKFSYILKIKIKKIINIIQKINKFLLPPHIYRHVRNFYRIFLKYFYKDKFVKKIIVNILPPPPSNLR